MPRADGGKPAKKKVYTLPKTRVPEAAKPKPKKIKPKRTPVQNARQQEKQYQSQGESVEKQANQQRARNQPRAGGDDKGAHEFERGQKYIRRQYVEKYGRERADKIQRTNPESRVLPPDIASRRERERLLKTKEKGAVVAPVAKALEQTTRPLHAVAAAERSLLKSAKGGRLDTKAVTDAGEAAVKGLKNEDKSTYDDVLGDLGVPKGKVRSVAAFAGDVVGDPLTYVSGGTGSVIRRQALKDAQRVEKKAAKAGLTLEQAKRMGDRARTQTERKGASKDSRGVTVSFAGKEAPGVRRGTAAVGRGARRVTDKTKPVRRIRDKARHLAADVNPGITPDNISRESFREVRRATRTARSSTAREIAKTKERAAAVRKLVKKADREILDAIESGTVKSLSPEKRQIAKRLQDQFKYARRLERRAGIPVKEIGGSTKRTVIERQTREVPVADAVKKAVARNNRKAAKHKPKPLERTVLFLEREVQQAKRSLGHYEEGSKAWRSQKSGLDELQQRLGAAREALGRPVRPRVRRTVAEPKPKQIVERITKTVRLPREPGSPKGYVPHALKDPEGAGKNARPRVGAMSIKPSFAKGREDRRTLTEIRKTDPEKFTEDAAVLYANRLIESHIASNKATLNRRLLDMGRRVRKGDDVQVGAGEKVFAVKGSDIREVTEKRELQRFVDEGDGGRGGQYVILNEQVVDRAVKNVIPTADRTAVGEVFDKVQGGWKWLATVPNIGFHVRNLVGDAQNAFLAESGGKLAVNTGKAAKVLKAVGNAEERRRKTLPGSPAELKTKTVKVGGEKISYDDLIKEAESVGAIRAGFINRELPELTKGSSSVKKVRKGTRPGRSVSRFIQNREDLFRLATYIGGRNKGLTPEKAAERASKFHFDYADLTQLERTVLRRVAPFYTFSARNIPLQLTSYFTKPGKYAQYQKLREEFANYFDIDLDEHEKNQTEFEQRSVGVPIKWKGEEFSLSFGPSGLPLTDLNELPMGKPNEAVDEWFQRAMSLLSPGVKTPLELGLNYSFFFRDQLERDEGPLVPAPSFVSKMPESMRKKLGVVDDYVDKRTGKKGWGWPAKADYVANLFPGPFGLGKRLSTESDRRGEDTKTKLIGAAGLRIRRVDAPSAAISRLFDEKAKLTKKRSALNQRGINAENPSKEWRSLSDEIKRLEAEINTQRGKRGDKIIPKRGRPSTKIKFPGDGGEIQWMDGAGDVEWVD